MEEWRIPQIEGPKEEGKSYNFRNKKNQHPDFWQMYRKFNLSKGFTRAADQTPNNVQNTPKTRVYMKECDDTSNLQLVRYSSWNLRYQTDMNQCSESIYAREATVIGITPALERISFLCSPLLSYTKRCSHPNKAIPGNYRINVTDPKLKYMPSCRTERGKNERIAT